MLEVKYLILGGGVSGLSFANNVGKDYIVIEKESQVGGYCRTIYKDGFTWDYAGHFFHFRDPNVKGFFKERMGDVDMLSAVKKTDIYIKDQYVDFPFQKNIHQLKKEDFLNCLHDLVFREEDLSPSDFGKMLYSKFGTSITEMFLKPYNEKLYATELNKLDVDAMGRFFPHADLKEIVSNFKVGRDDSYNSEFLYPKRGAFSFIEALLQELDPSCIKVNEKAVNIDLENKVLKTDKEEYHFEYLISSIPLDRLLSLCSIDAPEGVLSSNKVLALNLGFDKPELSSEGRHWTYVPENKFNFYRIGYYSNILKEDRLSMYVEVGFKQGENVSVDFELEKALNGLEVMGVIDSSHKLVSWDYVIMDPAYVHISRESENYKRKVMSKLESDAIYSIGRYGAWTYCSIEDNVIQARELSEKIL